MRFTRGKTLADPIYLKKPKDEYWMEGDVYTALSKCLRQIFKKNFTITAFKTKCKDLLRDKEYTLCSVEDQDRDVHTFVAVVVDELPWEKKPTVKPRGFEEPIGAVPITITNKPDTPTVSAEANKPEEKGIIVVDEPQTEHKADEVVEDFDKIRADIKQEVEIEKMKQEMEKENLLTNEEDFGNLPPKKSTKRPRRANKS